MNARRSDKCMSFLNNYYGECFDDTLNLTNKEFDNIIRILYGQKLVNNSNSNDIVRCKRCNIQVDDLAIHFLQCKKGKNSKWRHDTFNKKLFELLNEEIKNVQLEVRPPDQQTRQLPDIIIHDHVMIKDNHSIKSCKVYLDTIIYDIFRKEHKISIEKGNYKIFSAGSLGEKEKISDYENKFANLRSKGYIFKPIGLESFGGFSKILKQIINIALASRAERTGKNIDILRNNYYVKMSMFFKKMLLESLYDHVDIL